MARSVQEIAEQGVFYDKLEGVLEINIPGTSVWRAIASMSGYTFQGQSRTITDNPVIASKYGGGNVYVTAGAVTKAVQSITGPISADLQGVQLHNYAFVNGGNVNGRIVKKQQIRIAKKMKASNVLSYVAGTANAAGIPVVNTSISSTGLGAFALNTDTGAEFWGHVTLGTDLMFKRVSGGTYEIFKVSGFDDDEYPLLTNMKDGAAGITAKTGAADDIVACGSARKVYNFTLLCQEELSENTDESGNFVDGSVSFRVVSGPRLSFDTTDSDFTGMFTGAQYIDGS